MKVGSLFSGIGGLDLGLEWAGMKVVWQVENDKFCNQILRRHWPEVKRYEKDIKEVDFRGVIGVDLICGGFPCQPSSCAGKMQGDKDERWLWPEFYRAICEVRPKWVLVENVPGLLSVNSGRAFAGILRDLAAGGYNAEWSLLPAAAFGAPHLRYRLFVVAYPDGAGCLQRRRGGANEKKLPSVEFSSEIRNPSGEGLQNRVFEPLAGRESFSQFERSNWWTTEPDMGRVAHGIPKRVDRIRSLGNAVVPQVAEWIGRRIIDLDKNLSMKKKK